MPWKVFKNGEKFCVHKMAGEMMGDRVACHDTEAEAMAQMRALYASEGKKAVSEDEMRRMIGTVAGRMDMKLTDEQMAAMMTAMKPMMEGDADQMMAAIGKRMQMMQGKKSGLMIHKQADGQFRWVGWVSNHFRDNDTPKEILSGAAHKEFVEHADATGEFPELWLWHVPGSKIGKADWLEFADGFLLSSGIFDSPALAESLAKSSDPLTMSHGFRRLEYDSKSNVTLKYRQPEQSITPQGAEANPWTRFETTKEVQSMPISEAKKAFLAKYLPADTLKAIEDNTTELRKAAEASGVAWKDVEAADLTPAAAAETPVPDPTPATLDTATIAEAAAAIIVERLQIKALSDTISGLTAQMGGLGALAEQVKALEATVKALKATDDQKIAQTMTPKAMEGLSLAWANKAASKRADTIVDEDKAGDKALADQRPFLTQLAEELTANIAGGR